MTPEPSLVTVATRQHPFSFPPAQTALLIIDMQLDFCDPKGFCGSTLGADLSSVQAIIFPIQQVLHWAREQGMLVIFTRESHLPDLSDVSPSKKTRYINAGSLKSCVPMHLTYRLINLPSRHLLRPS
jgi:biuret amidohydrolase